MEGLMEFMTTIDITAPGRSPTRWHLAWRRHRFDTFPDL